MAYVYKEAHLEQTPHNLKYKYGSSFTPTQITYHQTSNNAPASNERAYLNSRNDAIYIGFHLVVDDKEALECIPLNIQTWHAGDGYGEGNMKSLGIEMAYSTSSDIELRNAAIENGAHLIATLMVKFNIPMAKVLPHQSRSGKYCPHDILSRYGHDKFRALIQTEYANLLKGTTSKPDTSTPTTITFEQYDVVTLSAPVGGYLSSTDTKSVKTFASGPYRVYKYVKGATHDLNISATGITPDAWIDSSKVVKVSQAPTIPTLTPDSKTSFKQFDVVTLTSSIPGYLSSTDTKSVKTFAPGTYKVYKFVKGAAHALNISANGDTADAWVDVSKVVKK